MLILKRQKAEYEKVYKETESPEFTEEDKDRDTGRWEEESGILYEYVFLAYDYTRKNSTLERDERYELMDNASFTGLMVTGKHWMMRIQRQ